MKRIVMTGLICLNASLAMSEITTEDAIFHPGPSTDSIEVVVLKSPEMHEVGSVFSGSSGIETPSMDVPIQPMPPYMIPGEFSAEKVANLKAAQLANMVKKGLIAPGVEMKMLRSGRSASEDLRFYSLSLTLHQRAIKEGKKGDYYIELLKEGKTIVEFDFQARSLEDLQKDVELCGTGFRIYPNDPNSRLCSSFASQAEAETHYIASKDTIDERNKTIEMLAAGNTQLGDLLTSKLKEIESLKATIKKLKKGRK